MLKNFYPDDKESSDEGTEEDPQSKKSSEKAAASVKRKVDKQDSLKTGAVGKHNCRKCFLIGITLL